LLYVLPIVDRADEAYELADVAVGAARAYGNPFWIAWALAGYGRAFTDTDPERALRAYREGLDYARDHGLVVWEARIARETAALEAVHGERDRALTLFEDTIDMFHRAGDLANTAVTLTYLAVFFERVDQPEVAATLYGIGTRHVSISMI